MAKYLIINNESLLSGDVLTKDDIEVRELTPSEVQDFMEDQVSGECDVIIQARGLAGLLKPRRRRK